MLIVDLESGKDMYIGGAKQENMAFVEVHYCSRVKHRAKQELTETAFEEINKAIGTSKDKMFLTIFEHSSWGAFGDFRDEFFSDDL